MIREAVTASPLYWPPGWERTKHPRRSAFARTSVDISTRLVLDELERLGADHRVIVSTNLRLRNDGLPRSGQRIPEDAGAAVWFTLDGEERVLACDRWDLVEHNLRAIAKHIEAIRAQDRWGVGTMAQAFRGFAALPESATGRGWRQVLELEDDVDLSADVVERAFKRRAMVCHPDHGGTTEQWHELALARRQGLEAAGA